MGITGELVKSVFFRSCSLGTQASNARSNVTEKKKWASVRSYLCGSEFSSVLAEQDSASVKCSEATVSQPISESLTGKEDIQFDETTLDMPEQRHLSMSKLFCEEDAAIVIQSAFRQFLVRRQNKEVVESDECKGEAPSGTETPSRESLGTSIEVQTGNSMEGLQVQEESMAKNKVQVLKIKEEWDCSAVSSNISKMKIRNRMEAMTRRERALAYAFTQQLRICSKRKQIRSADPEQNMSWSWLERWMATCAPESSLVENSSISKQVEPVKRNDRFISTGIAELEDTVGEEKESCGSNDVSVHFDRSSLTAPEEDGFRPSKNKLKPPRSVSRRKTMPSHQLSKDYCTKQVGKKDGSIERRDKKHMNKKLGLKKKGK